MRHIVVLPARVVQLSGARHLITKISPKCVGETLNHGGSTFKINIMVWTTYHRNASPLGGNKSGGAPGISLVGGFHLLLINQALTIIIPMYMDALDHKIFR